MPTTKPKTFTLILSLPMRARLERVAEREDRSLGYIIRKAISEYLERTER